MKRLDQILAMLILLLAVRAVLIAPREFTLGARPWPGGFWMLSSSLLLAVCGALSLLRIQYGATAPGLRAVAALTAIAVGALLLSAGIIADETGPSAVVAGLLLATASMALRATRTA
jgi:hypothetical protein